MTSPSWAAIIAAFATVITAFGGLILAIGVLVPILRRTRQTQSAVEQLTQVTQDKLDAIKVLADGSLTAAYRAELAAVEAQVIAMRKPSPDTQSAIDVTEARLAAMRQALADREASITAAHQLIANGTADAG